MRGHALLLAAMAAMALPGSAPGGGAPLVGYERDRVAGRGMSVPKPKSQKKRRKQRRR